MTRTIWDISADMAALESLLWESGGEITPQVDQAITAWEAEIQGDLHGKLENYARLIHELEARSKARADEAKRIAALAKADATAAENLRERLRLVWRPT